jgi:hypothetical protein
VQESWSFSRYEILPDKIIVYLWANPGDTQFDFKFKPRYGINERTASPVVYDYYNDEARATLAPKLLTRFRVDFSAQSARTDVRFEVSVFVVKSAILRRVANHALHVAFRFAERNGFDEFVNFKRQSIAPLRTRPGPAL